MKRLVALIAAGLMSVTVWAQTSSSTTTTTTTTEQDTGVKQDAKDAAGSTKRAAKKG